MNLAGRSVRAACIMAVQLAHAAVACAAAAVMLAAAGCGDGPRTSLQRLNESRQLSAEVLVQFTMAREAANRAVMADTGEAAAEAVREAGRATEEVQKRADSLRPLLEALGYADETRLLSEFVDRFARYRALDRSILDLAMEGTNLKAQRLSFGPVQEAADAFGAALEGIEPAAPAKDSWQVKALLATALLHVREIQALQAPHIAAADDAEMSRLEQRMIAAEAAARNALGTLARLVDAASRARLAAANEAFDRFAGLNGEVIALSRRNTNLRSLALSLGEKRMLAAACEESMRSLQAALDRREFTGTR